MKETWIEKERVEDREKISFRFSLLRDETQSNRFFSPRTLQGPEREKASSVILSVLIF